MKGQVVQILDSAGAVAAQIVDGKYSLYIAEDDPRAQSIMQTVGMIGTYMGIMDVMD